MKKNRKIKLIRLFCAAAAVFAAGTISCGTSRPVQKAAEAAPAQRQPGDNDSLMTLIPDYSGMTENEAVAAAWIEKGFSLAQCRTIQVYPVTNYSRSDAAGVQQALQTELERLFAQRVGGERGTITAGVLSAIIAVKKKTEFLKRFSPAFDDIPSLTVEIIIVDETTKKTLCKLCHSAKHEEFSQALDALTDGIRRFVELSL